MMDAPLPPSREEQRSMRWAIATLVIALIVLGLGAMLRFTILKSRFEPAAWKPDKAALSPSPTPSPGSLLK